MMIPIQSGVSHHGCGPMKFSLIFDGHLPSSGGGKKGTRKKEKQVIRRALDPQLRRVWNETPDLKYLRENSILNKNGKYIWTQPHPQHMDSEVQAFRRPFDGNFEIDVCSPISVGKGEYLPLVRDSLGLRCELDIIFMRNEPPGHLLSNGDIDNRLKTLFDGLCMPNKDQVPKGDDFSDWPLHCLLENDGLISAINVRTEKLLTPKSDSTTEVRLVIGVNIKVTRGRPFNLVFYGD